MSSILEKLHPDVASIGKSHFFDDMSAKKIRDWWSVVQKAGSGSSGALDGIDNGIFLTTGPTVNAEVAMDFGDKRPFNKNGCKFISKLRFDNPTIATAFTGFTEQVSTAPAGSAGNDYVGLRMRTSDTFWNTAVRSGGASAVITDTAVFRNTSPFDLEITLGASSSETRINRGISTVNAGALPTVNLQAFLWIITSNASAKTVEMMQCEAFNT